jgi:hypothetical protein
MKICCGPSPRASPISARAVSGNGAQYRAGDLWGSVGAWFSGRWHDAEAADYIVAVRRAMAPRPLADGVEQTDWVGSAVFRN